MAWVKGVGGGGAERHARVQAAARRSACSHAPASGGRPADPPPLPARCRSLLAVQVAVGAEGNRLLGADAYEARLGHRVPVGALAPDAGGCGRGAGGRGVWRVGAWGVRLGRSGSLRKGVRAGACLRQRGGLAAASTTPRSSRTRGAARRRARRGWGAPPCSPQSRGTTESRSASCWNRPTGVHSRAPEPRRWGGCASNPRGGPTIHAAQASGQHQAHHVRQARFRAADCTIDSRVDDWWADEGSLTLENNRRVVDGHEPVSRDPAAADASAAVGAHRSPRPDTLHGSPHSRAEPALLHDAPGTRREVEDTHRQ